jgi:hypothetical protein
LATGPMPHYPSEPRRAVDFAARDEIGIALAL